MDFEVLSRIYIKLSALFPKGLLLLLAVFVFPLVRESRSGVRKLGH